MFSPAFLKEESLVLLCKSATAPKEGDDAFSLGAARKRKSSCITHAALFASLLVFVFLLVFCSSVQRRENLPSSLLLHRMLSHRKYFPSHKLFLKCAATTTNDDTNPNSDTSAFSSQDKERNVTEPEVGSEPNAKKLRFLAGALTKSAESPESLAEPSSASLADDDAQHVTASEPQQEPFKSAFKPQLKPDPEFVAGPSFLSPFPSPTLPQRQEPFFCPTLPQSTGRLAALPATHTGGAPHLNEPSFVGLEGRCAEEADAAKALLLLLQRTPPSGRPEQVEQATRAHPPEVAPSLSSPKPLSAASQEKMGAVAVEAVFVDPEEGPSSRGAPSGPSLLSDTHPFARVPKLAPGVIARPFSALHARTSDLAISRPGKMLSEMHSLFLNDTLDAREATLVVSLLELLMAHAFEYQTAEVSYQAPSHAASVLGIRFLVLDAIVAGFMAVGQTPPSDLWKDFAAAVPHKFSPRPMDKTGEPSGHPGPPVLRGPPRPPGLLGPPGLQAPSGPEGKLRPSPYRDLAMNLSAALETLKTGTRPPAAELIAIKRMMFCSKFIIRRFQTPAFDLWKKHCDDGNAEKQ